MTSAGLALLVMGCLWSSEGQRGQIGFKRVDGSVLVRIRSCDEAVRIEEVRLVADTGEVGNTEPALWSIREASAGGKQAEIIEIGSTPVGFEEAIPLRETLNMSETYVLIVSFASRGDLNLRRAFNLPELDPDTWNVRGDALSEREFEDLDLNCQ